MVIHDTSLKELVLPNEIVCQKICVRLNSSWLKKVFLINGEEEEQARKLAITKSCQTLLVSYCCHNKVPQTRRLKATEIVSLF